MHPNTLNSQVLSQSVSKALLLTKKTELEESAHFASIFDKFFDSMNVGNFTNGKYKRKVFQQPYRSGTDFRLKVLGILHSLFCCQRKLNTVFRD